MTDLSSQNDPAGGSALEATPSAPGAARRSSRVWVFIGWLLVGACLAALLLYPIRDTFSRLGILVAGAIFVLMAFVLAWPRPLLRYLVIALLALAAVLVTLPGRPAAPAELAGTYADYLRSYAGCRYVWGGETSLGIDCSGLIRSAMINAECRRGLSLLDGRMLRHAAWLWWHDASAGDMRNGYAGQMSTIADCQGVIELKADVLQPGDVAVVGLNHVMAYLGDGTWIEADPGKLQVLPLRGAREAWLTCPARLMRWHNLE